MNSECIFTISLDELPVGSSKLINAKGRQVAVFRIGAEDVYAVDNQCPHEGYPLIKGTVKECVLTCPWHNFKFNLTDGECIKGSEAVGTYPVRILENRIGSTLI